MKIRIQPGQDRLSISFAEGDVAETKTITEELPEHCQSASLNLDANGYLLSAEFNIPNFAAIWAALK